LQKLHHFHLQIGQEASISNQGSTKGKKAGLILILTFVSKIADNISVIRYLKCVKFIHLSTTIHSTCQKTVSCDASVFSNL
jgi:hypothetical protein